jgi:hypothetical protein
MFGTKRPLVRVQSSRPRPNGTICRQMVPFFIKPYFVIPFWLKQPDIQLNLFFVVRATLHQQIKTVKNEHCINRFSWEYRKPAYN